MEELQKRILDSMPAIERWFRLEWMEHTPLFYSAVDIRNAGYKLSPVDLDLYPGQWHRLTADMVPLAVQAAMAGIEKICPEARNLMLIPDHRIHESEYQHSLAQLLRIFHMAGFNVRVGSIDPNLTETRDIAIAQGAGFTIEPVLREGQRLQLKHFDPCTLLLNHDLGQGIPGILEDLVGQYLLPPLHGAWATRQRGDFGVAYEDLAKRFGKLLGVDPWLISPMCHTTDVLDVNVAGERQQLADQVDELLQKIKRKYRDYSIDDTPVVVVKANQGRDATGLFSVSDARQIQADAVAKSSPGLSSARDGRWLLQEGVDTHTDAMGISDDPVVYMIDRYVVGGFYRTDEPVVMAPQTSAGVSDTGHNRFYVYGVIARLAMLAGSYQLEATDPQAHLFD